MARVDLRCTSCGFHFSVTDTQAAKPEGVRCPSCLAPVGVSGPVEGGGRKPGQVLQASPDNAGLKVKIGIGVGVGVLVVVLVLVLVLMGKPAPPPEEPAVTTTKQKQQTAAPAAKAKQESRPDDKAKAKARPESTKKVESTPSPSTSSESDAPVTKSSRPQAVADPALPADLLKSVRDELLALKEWHLSLVLPAAEKARVEKLAADGKGSAADLEFLRSLMSGPRFRAVKEEASLIRETRARLETEALEGLPVDKVTKTDGTVINGRIIEETETAVKLERKIAGGSTAEMMLPKAGLKEILKGKGIGSEFKSKWEEAKKGGVPVLVGLLAWCKENSLNLQASLAAYTLLADDPGRAEARQQADMKYDPVARLLKAEEEGGFITTEGRRWLPSDLKAKLLRDGYVLIDRHWMKGKQFMATVPTLFTSEPQNFKGVSIVGNLAQEESVTFNVKDGQEKIDSKPVRRFYAATPMSTTQVRRNLRPQGDADQVAIEEVGNPLPGSAMRGEVTITVSPGAPILEASVVTSAEVRSGGSIIVYQMVDGRRVELYKCDPKESRSHKLNDLVRGKTEVQLVAELSGTARYDKKTDTKRARNSKKDNNSVIEKGLDITYTRLIPEYPAMLFPSNNNTTEVFRFTATIAEPAPGLDKLFENAQAVLEK
jgi:hypothetical protein